MKPGSFRPPLQGTDYTCPRTSVKCQPRYRHACPHRHVAGNLRHGTNSACDERDQLLPKSRWVVRPQHAGSRPLRCTTAPPVPLAAPVPARWHEHGRAQAHLWVVVGEGVAPTTARRRTWHAWASTPSRRRSGPILSPIPPCDRRATPASLARVGPRRRDHLTQTPSPLNLSPCILIHRL